MVQDLIKRVYKWATDRDLINYEGLQAQCDYVIKESVELLEAIDKSDEDEIMDGIGDTFVTILNAHWCSEANYFDSKPWDCSTGSLEHSIIRGRYSKSIDPHKSIRALINHFSSANCWVNVEPNLRAISEIAMNYGFDPVDCFQHAIKEIEDRTGKTVNGVFIKD